MTAIAAALLNAAPRAAADPFDGMDIEAARAFLRRLDPDAERFTIQTVDDTDAKRKSLAKIRDIEIDGPGLDTLRSFNVQRAGVFVAINETDGRGRSAHNVLRVRAVFVDLDGAPLEPVLAAGLDPHIVVESSPGRWHAYWRVSDCPLEQFKPVQQALARRFDGDPSVSDLPRVMRLPGFLHQKGVPFQTKMIGGHDRGAPYELAEIVGTLGLSFDEPAQRVNGHAHHADSVVGEGNRNATLFAFGRRLHAQGTDDAGIDAAMRRENAARCNPPLPEGELAGLIRNVQTAKDDPAWVAAKGATGGDPGAWPEPAPLPAALPPVEAFAPELMPAALRPWVADIAERVQCPPDFVAVAAMVGLGSVLGRRIALYPKRRDDWCEFANLWGLVIGPPGVLKSPAIREALRPLRKLEHEASERHVADVSQWREDVARRGIVRAAAKARALKAATKGNDFDASGLIETGDPDEPGMRRYVVNDSSVEALGEVLRGNPHGTLVYQDELAGLLRQLDREGNEGARAFWLAGWSGSEPYTFDRIGRGLNRRVDAVCLALFGSIQPAVIGDYLRDAATNGGGDGLMARMSMLVWPDVVGEWRNVDEYPDTQARRAAVEVFERFDAITGPDVGGEADERGHYALRFGDEAQAEFNAWREGFERAQREADIHPALIAHRNKYRKAVPALALIAHLTDHPAGGPVGKAALLRALAWVDYLDSHAQRAYASVTRTDADGARELLRRIRRGDVADPFRVRDVYRNGWRLLSEPEQVHRAARLLVEFDYLRERVEDTGGRAATVYDVNPRGRQ